MARESSLLILLSDKYPHLLKPWIITAFSIVVSNLMYAGFYLTTFHSYDTGWYGFPISTIIPILVAYPTSAAVIRMMKRMEVLNRKLTIQNTFRSQILGVVAHDVRSPLAVLVNLIDLYNDSLTQEEFNELIEQLKPQLAFTQDTLDRLTLWVKMHMDEKNVNSSRFRLKDLESTLQEYGSRWGEYQDVKLKIDWDSSLTAHADVQAVIIALTNIVNNAMKFSPKGEEVTLTSELKDKQLHIHVTDCGSGIPDTVRNQLFDDTTLPTQDRQKGGVGVGLFLSNEFVQMTGGKLSAENMPEKGARFSITLRSA